MVGDGVFLYLVKPCQKSARDVARQATAFLTLEQGIHHSGHRLCGHFSVRRGCRSQYSHSAKKTNVCPKQNLVFTVHPSLDLCSSRRGDISQHNPSAGTVNDLAITGAKQRKSLLTSFHHSMLRVVHEPESEHAQSCCRWSFPSSMVHVGRLDHGAHRF